MLDSKLIDAARKLRDAEASQPDAVREFVATHHLAVLAHVDAIEAENRRLRLDNARLSRLPEMEWRTVCEMLEGTIATMVRSGHADEARNIMQAIEAGTTYVTRLLAKVAPE